MEKFKEKILRFKEYYFEKRSKVLSYFLISVILLCFCVCSYIIFDSNSDNEELKSVSVNDDILNEKSEKEIISNIFVDIKGAVKSPGVYEIASGSKVIDVINSAGGLLDNSNTRFVNLSKKLNDGDVVVIYTNEEIEEAKKSEIIYVETPCICEEVNSSCIENNIESESDLININTATLDDLMKLNGIGEVKAKSILEYREKNGNFNSIEDLLNVDGISETVFKKIKENITV